MKNLRVLKELGGLALVFGEKPKESEIQSAD